MFFLKKFEEHIYSVIFVRIYAYTSMITNIKHSIVLLFLGICVSSGLHAAIITAIIDGDWNTATTWDCNCIPTNADDVIIPEGIDVTTSVDLSIFRTLDIQEGATLTVTGDLITPYNGFIQTVTVSGILTVTGNFDLRNAASGMSVTVNSLGKMYVNTDIITTISSNSRAINNYGYIEVGQNFKPDQTVFTNYSTGTILIKGNITGGSLGSGLTVRNYGIITVDTDMSLIKTDFTNYASGYFFVFGDISFGDGSNFINQGLVQCDVFTTLSGSSLYNNTGGTVISLVNYTYEGGTTCPGCTDKVGTLYYTVVSGGDLTWCSSLHCDEWIMNQPTTIPIVPGRRIWLAADFIGYGLTTDGQKINKWFDLANTYGFEMAQSNVANQPSIKNNSTDNVNFNPLISFDGANINMDLDDEQLFAPAIDGGLAMFAVVVPKNGGAADQAIFDYGKYSTDGMGLYYSDQNLRAYTPTAHGGAENSIIGHSYGTTPKLLSQTTTWSGDQVLYVNGVQQQSQAVTLTQIEGTEIAESNPLELDVSGPFTLGNSSVNTATYDFDGKIAEVIIYATSITEPVRKSTESFLALKYGMTLDYDYTNYDNSTVFSVVAPYNNGIFGLAREDRNHLHQKQSKSINSNQNLILSTAARVPFDQRTVSTGITVDNSYIVCGNNGNPLNDGTRIYKVTTTNFNQEVTLSFKFTGIDAPYPDLTIDVDDSFTNSPTTVSPDSYDGNYLVYKYTFTNNATSYFKVGAVTVIPREPGVGINTTAIDTSAQLHVYSTDKGVLLPALTTAQMNAIVNPPNGLLIYNTTENRYYYNSGIPATPAWIVVGRLAISNNALLGGAGGDSVGEIRYNTDTNTLWYWNGTSWKELLDN
ncbi:MAG: hypothetical protein BWY22_00409 [Bacteroidetes bacterium ADurb.Bin217]|nr:MAG: hypothetical protein BWY22_00409 [Bacteroidetes bacterium ADurb.Bin217]